MAEPEKQSRSAGGYVVLRELEDGLWQVVGDVDRRTGLTARAGRIQAVKDATGDAARDGETYAALPRSEWRVAQQM
jgi:hypothetical protein